MTAPAVVRYDGDVPKLPPIVWHLDLGKDSFPDACHVDVVWAERRRMPPVIARVEASVIPSSGVGWLDLAWSTLDRGGGANRKAVEQHRVLANWEGKLRAEVIREVIPLADAWFDYCEREAAVHALAAQQLAADPDSERSGGSDYLPLGGSLGRYVGAAAGAVAATRRATVTPARGWLGRAMVPGGFVEPHGGPLPAPEKCTECGALTNNDPRICSGCVQGRARPL